MRNISVGNVCRHGVRYRRKRHLRQSTIAIAIGYGGIAVV